MRLANNERSRVRRERAAAAVKANGGVAPIPQHMHGTEGGATNHKCPCDDCRAAATAARRARAGH